MPDKAFEFASPEERKLYLTHSPVDLRQQYVTTSPVVWANATNDNVDQTDPACGYNHTQCENVDARLPGTTPSGNIYTAVDRVEYFYTSVPAGGPAGPIYWVGPVQPDSQGKIDMAWAKLYQAADHVEVENGLNVRVVRSSLKNWCDAFGRAAQIRVFWSYRGPGI